MAELTFVGGGVWLTPMGVELREGHHGGQRLHQHPNDPDDFLTIHQLAELFVTLNDNEFELEQVDGDVLSTLWQIDTVDDILQSGLFLDSAKDALRRSAARATESGCMRMFTTQGIAKHLVHPLPGEITMVPGHPFEASAVCLRFLVFQVFPSEGRSSQSVNFHLELEAGENVPGFAEQMQSLINSMPVPSQQRTSFGVGCPVIICGLRSQPEHNGAEGAVRSYDSSSGRHAVQLSLGGWLKVRPTNLRAVPADEASDESVLREKALAEWREMTGAAPGAMPTPRGFHPDDQRQNEALTSLEPDAELLGVTDVVTAVQSGRFGKQAVARLHQAVKKKACVRYLDDSLVRCDAALLGEPKFNAVFWISTDVLAPLQFKGREAYTPNAVFMHFASRMQSCDHCGKAYNGDLSLDEPDGTMQRLKTCAGCGVAEFCNRECQEASWRLHRKWCRAASRLDADTPMLHVGEIRSQRMPREIYREGLRQVAAQRDGR